MLALKEVTLSRGSKILLKDASITIFDKQKVGLIGQNGCGKSSLFQLILKGLSPDKGEFSINGGVRIAHLAQHTPDSGETALNYVLSGDEEYTNLCVQLAQAEQTNNADMISACHERLAQIEGYSKSAQAAIVLAGLGFKNEDHQNPVNSFSGGWRMRLSLARCLMKPADLLLLDEPTNHLDMEAIVWLEKWLKQIPQTVILISHDRDFLDAIITHTLHVEQQNLNMYAGNYSKFEQARAEKMQLQNATYQKQQEKINHLMSFVKRFSASAAKAKQAQSRLKAIEKMEIAAQAHSDSPFSFIFASCPKAGKPLIKCEAVGAGYEDKILLKKINFTLNPGDKFALLGPNGQGKSTFIKTLCAEIPPISGQLYHSPHLKIGYFAQHQLEDLDKNLSPLQTIQRLDMQAKEQTIRDFLGGFNFIGDMATTAIAHFSGGEKARLALAKIVWQKPNLLLLDEPTNHLDIEMRAAIELALQTYEGALLLISHDRHLVRACVDEFYLIYDGNVQTFKGDLEDYSSWLQTKQESSVEAKASVSNYREKKSLQNRLKKIEENLELNQCCLKSLEVDLGNQELYTEVNRQLLKKTLAERKNVESQLDCLESEWLTIIDLLENID
jgi:ATP-binding cassette subfamily F protein 3